MQMNNFKQRISAFVHSRNFFSGVLVAVVIAAVVFLNIIVYTLDAYFGLYIYNKPEEDLSIGDASDALFAEAMAAGEKVTVTFCMYEDDVKTHTTGSYVYRTAKEFEARYPEFIELRYVSVITRLDSEGEHFDTSKYEKDMRGMDTVINETTVIFESGDNYRVLTDVATAAGYVDFYTLDDEMYITSYNGEEVFAAMSSWVLSDEHGTAYFTVGHSETPNLSLYNVLACAGYYVDTVNLRREELPEDASLVVVCNPLTDFERAAEGSSIKTEIERLTKFMNDGGSMLVTLDPQAKRLTVFEKFLADFGIEVMRTDSGESNIVKDTENGITTDGFTLVCDYAGSDVSAQMSEKISAEDGRIVIRSVAALKLSGDAQPLLVSSSAAVCQAAGETVDRSGSYTVAACSSRENEDGSTARIVVVPSVYLTATDAIVTNGYSNKDFLYSLFDVFYGHGGMPYGCRSVVYESYVLENLTIGEARLYTALLIAIPVILAGVGVFVTVRRRNR